MRGIMPVQHEPVRLVANAELPRVGGPERPLVEVAVGVLIRSNGDFLLTSRPLGKVYAGYWEFPGGKQEVGETVAQALARELQEELGILIGPAVPWQVATVDYPHALVRLNFLKVYQWTGELQMREAQSCAWQNLPVQVSPVLPGTLPVLQWLTEERAASSASVN
jgi:8-oxo-dGTP diphosphatase